MLRRLVCQSLTTVKRASTGVRPSEVHQSRSRMRRATMLGGGTEAVVADWLYPGDFIS